MMTKTEFIEEVNKTIPNINITDENIEYTYKDKSDYAMSGNNLNITQIQGEVSIKYNGQCKTYQSGHGTTFPSDFITDYNSGYYN